MERPKLISLVALCTMLGCGLFHAARPQRVVVASGEGTLLHEARTSKTDLEVSWPGGDGGAARRGYVAYTDLLALPQVSATVISDDDFTELHGQSVQVTGVEVSLLVKALKVPANQDMMMARCIDGYEGQYPAEYVAAHHPILVLTINGLTAEAWAAKSGNVDPGPYMISYAGFVPSWKVLSHQDRPQVPDQVLELEFKRQADVFGPITPSAQFGKGSPERAGFAIAKQNCLRCHNAGPYGGTKAGWSWETLSMVAKTDPATFEKYIHNPQGVNPKAKMVGTPQYDAATLDAIRAYFQSLAK